MQRGPWPKCLRSAAGKESLGTPSRHPISRRTAPRSEQPSCQPRAFQVPQSSNHTPPLPSAACRIRAVAALGKEKIRRCLPAHQEHESLVAHDVEDAWVNHMHTAISSFATTFHKSNCIATDLLKLLHDICFACPWDHLPFLLPHHAITENDQFQFSNLYNVYTNTRLPNDGKLRCSSHVCSILNAQLSKHIRNFWDDRNQVGTVMTQRSLPVVPATIVEEYSWFGSSSVHYTVGVTEN